MTQASRQPALSIAQIATGLGILAFWSLFFTVGMAPAQPLRCFFAFEHAFPLPDTTLAVALVASGVNLLKGGAWGRDVSLACSGGLLFLGLVDLSFAAQNGVFAGPLADALQWGLISLWCSVLGLWILAARSCHGYCSAPE